MPMIQGYKNSLACEMLRTKVRQAKYIVWHACSFLLIRIAIMEGNNKYLDFSRPFNTSYLTYLLYHHPPGKGVPIGTKCAVQKHRREKLDLTQKVSYKYSRSSQPKMAIIFSTGSLQIAGSFVSMGGTVQICVLLLALGILCDTCCWVICM